MKLLQRQKRHYSKEYVFNCLPLLSYIEQFGEQELQQFYCRNQTLTDFFYASSIQAEIKNELRTYVVYATFDIPEYNIHRGEIAAYFSLKSSTFTVDYKIGCFQKAPKCYPTIEIYHLANNERFINKSEMKGLGMYVFTQYILPIAKNVQKQIGVKMIILYAADLSKDKKLIKTYENYGFVIPPIHPKYFQRHIDKYDEGCQLMLYFL